MPKHSMRADVREGYNQGDYVGVYRNRRTLTSFEDMFFKELIRRLKRDSNVLDLGSGSGIPYDHYLAEKGLNVTGIDVSEKHIALARSNVPNATYVLGDFLEYPFPSEQFDAILSLYSLFHVPRGHHLEVIAKIAKALKKNGHLLITVGTEDVEHKEKEDFCGAPMAWSYFDTQTNIDILSQCGFSILKALNEKDFGSDEKHVWILAKK